MDKWKNLRPGLLPWFRKAAHPHGECVKALMKKGYPKERANRICAKTKDKALGTTKWREGSR